MSTKTSMPSSSEGAAARSVGNQDQQLSLPLPGVTVASVDDPKEARRNYHRMWRERNRERWNQYSKRDWDKHREKRIAARSTPEAKEKNHQRCREYRAKNPEKVKQLMKKWHSENKDYMKAYRAKYGPRRRELYHQNREKVLQQIKVRAPRYRLRVQAYCHRKRRTDIQYALKDRLRATMGRALRRQWVEKSMRTMELIGCSVEDLKAYLSAQFVNGMSWENKGTWHVDHFVPLSAFDLRDVEEQKVAFNWKNLRPIPCHENHAKSDKIPDPLPTWIPDTIQRRIKEMSL